MVRGVRTQCQLAACYDAGVDSPISAKAAMLQALTMGPGFGLELIERVKVATGGAVVLHQGSVYPTLRELEADGLAVSTEEPASG